MLQVCEFDIMRDIRAVEQSGFIDLAAANASSSVPSGISNQEMSYNDIDDPNSIAGRPSDTFEAAGMNKAIVGYKAPKQNE